MSCRFLPPKLSPKHPSWAFYVCVVGIIIGVVLNLLARPSLSLQYLVIFLLAASLLLISLFRTNLITLILAFVAGILFATCRTGPEIIDANYLAAKFGETVTISGRIASEPSEKSQGLVVHLTDLQLLPDGPDLHGTLYVQLAQKNLDLLRSDRLTLTGKLGEPFGTFAASLFRPKIIGVERASPGDLAIKFKNFFAGLVREHISSPAADLGLAYLVGDKTHLSEDFNDALRAVGMTHVVVASGAHLGILVGLIKKLFGKISKFAGLLFSLLAIFAFALVVGFTASMTRASLVAALSLLFGYVGREFTPLRLILFVAALTLLISPSNLLNLGWQLSFASFFGILVLAPRLTRFLYGGKKPRFLASMLITSFATNLVCAPLLIFNFGTFSLLSFVANLVILPTLPYAMLLVFLTGATSFCLPLALPISALASALLNFHINFITFLSTKTALIFELPAADPRVFLLYLPVLILLLAPPARRLLRRRTHHPPQIIAETLEICYNDEHEPPEPP